MPAWEIVYKLNSKRKRPPPPVQQRLDVGNRAGAADTAFKKKNYNLQKSKSKKKEEAILPFVVFASRGKIVFFLCLD